MPSNNSDEFIEVLGELTALCQKSMYDFVIIGGDFNVSFERDNHSNIIALNDFLSEQCLNRATVINGVAGRMRPTGRVFETPALHEDFKWYLICCMTFYKFRNQNPLPMIR